LPKSVEPFNKICKVISENKELFNNVVFHFVGTGKFIGGKDYYSVKPIAEQYGIYGSIIREYPKRIPYLDVLAHLAIANGVFVLGSTEPHYTPSKVYQGVLSKKPIMAVLHSESTAVKVLKNTNTGVVLEFNGENDVVKIENEFSSAFLKYLEYLKSFNPELIDFNAFDECSAKSVTKNLAELLIGFKN